MEVQTIGTDSWNSNSLTFTEPFDAMQYAVDLARRWKLVEHIRITPI